MVKTSQAEALDSESGRIDQLEAEIRTLRLRLDEKAVTGGSLSEQRTVKDEVGGDPVKDVMAYLQRLGLAQYGDSFVKEEIWVDRIQHLTPEDLDRMGITAVGARCVLLAAIAESRHGRLLEHSAMSRFNHEREPTGAAATVEQSSPSPAQARQAALVATMVADLREEVRSLVQNRDAQTNEPDPHRPLMELQIASLEKGYKDLYRRVRNIESILLEHPQRKPPLPLPKTEEATRSPAVILAMAQDEIVEGLRRS